MTTNAGASDMARNGIGFGDVSKADAGDEAVKRMFSPEFRNRLDATSVRLSGHRCGGPGG